ncbi:hypothetical protein AA313_de0206462 [Arthrobotrys entomopaga]|nr:hypothetical protein AA313_de0206462 [Arthrobotrys entomopaga]
MAQQIDVAGIMQNWAPRDIANIPVLMQNFGGWELWAQGEIALYINFNVPLIATMNPNCYSGPAGMADIQLSGGEGFIDTVIEVKAKREITETPQQFAARVLVDFAKIHRNIGDAWVGDRFWSVGFSNNENHQAIFDKLSPQGYAFHTIEGDGFNLDIWAYFVDR